jgi:hypothetical protein
MLSLRDTLADVLALTEVDSLALVEILSLVEAERL